MKSKFAKNMKMFRTGTNVEVLIKVLEYSDR